MVRLEQAKGLEAATQLEGSPRKNGEKVFCFFFSKKEALSFFKLLL